MQNKAIASLSNVCYHLNFPTMLLDWLRIKLFVLRHLPRGPGTVCVDLDSVLIYHKSEWGNRYIGRVLPFGLKLCQLLRERGKTIIVLTARPVEQHAHILRFLNDHKFGIDSMTNVKPVAEAYFDDRAVRVSKNWK